MTKLSYWPVNGSKESIPYRYFESVKHVRPSDFMFAKQGDMNTFRLYYDDGLVRASIVTILPNEFGLYDDTPESMSEQLEEFLKLNLVNIIGGCCGTTPEHINEMYKLTLKYKPRSV